MAGRRQEKMSRVIKEAVSDAIRNHLQDPRIEGLVTVTEVKMPADLKSAEVYVSVLGTNEAGQRKTFAAIEHAGGYIQSLVGRKLTTKFCPHIYFHLDERLKKTMEMMKLMDELSKEKGPDNSEV